MNIKLNSHEQKIHDLAIQGARAFKICELELINILRQADELQYFRKLEFTSLYEYAHRGLGLSEAVSYNFMSIARKSRKVPELTMALESAAITVSNAKLLVSVITPENKDHWLKLASTLPKPKLEREIAKASPRAIVQEKAKYVQEHLISLTLALTPETFELLKRVQDLESQRTRKPATYDDSVKAMAELYIRRCDPHEKARRANSPSGRVQEINSTADLPVETKGTKRFDQHSQQVVQPVLPSEVNSHSAIPFLRQKINSSLRHQISLRDHSRCSHIAPDGRRCENRRWLETHHKIPIASGGMNELPNLVTLCSGHHRSTHFQGPKTEREGLIHVK